MVYIRDILWTNVINLVNQLFQQGWIFSNMNIVNVTFIPKQHEAYSI